MDNNLPTYACSDITKGEQIQRMFDSIAPRYDFLNHLLSVGIDRMWRRALIKDLEVEDPHAVLDVATGTGDLAIAMARGGIRKITGSDISEGMLAIGRKKADKAGLDIDMVMADAQNLPFGEGSFDAVTSAFGIRNFPDPQTALDEMFRVLHPGGVVYILEFSKPDNNIILRLFRFYFHNVFPLVGRIVSHDSDAYKYLPRSVDAFPCGERFAGMMLRAGFSDVKIRRMTGGIATIYKARK